MRIVLFIMVFLLSACASTEDKENKICMDARYIKIPRTECKFFYGNQLCIDKIKVREVCTRWEVLEPSKLASLVRRNESST